MAYTETTDDTSSSSAPAGDPFEGMRDPGTNPYHWLSVGGWSWTYVDKDLSGKETKLWVLVPDSTYQPALPTAPEGRTWRSIDIRVNNLSGGIVPNGVAQSLAVAGHVFGDEDDVGVYKPPIGVKVGPVTTVPQGGGATLGPGAYKISVDATIDKWHGSEEDLLVVPAGKSLVLDNPMTNFEVVGPFAGVFRQTRTVTVRLTYQQVIDDGTGKAPTVGADPATFWASMRHQFANRTGFGVDAKGDFGLDISGNPWRLTWPTVSSSGTLLGGGLDTLNAIGAWLVKWGPWILVALGVILAFFLLPHIILLLVRAFEAWQLVGAQLGAIQ